MKTALELVHEEINKAAYRANWSTSQRAIVMAELSSYLTSAIEARDAEIEGDCGGCIHDDCDRCDTGATDVLRKEGMP